MRIKIHPETVAENFSRFRDNSSLQESAQLFARGLPIPEMIQALAMNGNVLSSFAGFEAIYPRGGLERGILEKVILAVSQGNHCQFCVASHQAITRGIGICGDNAATPDSPEHSARERIAIEYALAVLSNSNEVADELFVRLRAVFQDTEIVELTFLTGFINMLNWFNNALGVKYRNDFSGVKVY